MKKMTKVTVFILVFAMLFSLTSVAEATSPESASTEKQRSLAVQMTNNFGAYHETFSSEEQQEIGVSLQALNALTDEQWSALLNHSGLLTEELIAKYPMKQDAETAMISLLRDVFRILYGMYDETVLYDACLNFIVEQSPTVGLIFDQEVTPEFLVALIGDAEDTLADFDISGSFNDSASDYWNVVYGSGSGFVYAADHIVTLALEQTIRETVLKEKMTELNWTVEQFSDLHELLIDEIDPDFRANTILYDSVFRKHSVLWNVTRNQEMRQGERLEIKIGKSEVFRFTLFGKNVSLPFGSYVQLPADGSLSMTTDTANGTFTVTANKEAEPFAMILRRGITGDDELVNRCNILRSFYVTAAALTPSDKVEFKADEIKKDDSTVQPTSKPKVEVVNSGGQEVVSEISVSEENSRYHLDVTADGENVTDGTSEKYEFSLEIPTDYKDTESVILYYRNEEGTKVIADSEFSDGVLKANVHYIGDYYVEKVGLGLLTKKRVAYMYGDDSGLFRPNDPMTRAEAAQMFYNLLDDKNVIGTMRFVDVDEDAWYATAVNVLSAYRVISGYNGEFRPDDTITREEFVVMAVKFFDLTARGTLSFTDVEKGRWSYGFILTAFTNGLISGYGDGTFRPKDLISRAEAPTVMNKMLKREPDEEYDVEGLKMFPDNADSEFWGYYQILEATNTFSDEAETQE